MKKKIYLALAALASMAMVAVITALPAFPADAPPGVWHKAPPPKPPAVYDWTGFTIGGNAGYGKQVGTTTQANSGVFASLFPAENGASESGLQLGVQASYKYQLNPMWVVGVAGDLDWLRHSASTSASAALGGINASTSLSSSVDWVGTVRGLVGFVPPNISNALIYFTGGGAWGKSNVSMSSALAPACVVGCGSASDSSVKSGWTWGGGVEVAFAQHWSLFGEYQHIDLGNVSLAYVGSGPAAVRPSFSSNTNLVIDLVRAGVNYKF